MNINWNKKYLTIAVYATCAVVVSAVLIMIIFNFDSFWGKMSALGAVITPVIIGIFCAYLLNPLMNWFEKKIFRKWSGSDNPKARGRARAFALTLTMIFVLLVMIMLIVLVIPQLTENIVGIFNNMDSYINTAKNWINDIFDDNPILAEFLGNPLDDFSNFIKDIWTKYSSELLKFAGDFAAGVWALLDTMKNVLLGLIISIYLLARKEMFIGQSKKLIFAFMKLERAQRFLSVCREASKKFLGSIVGKIIEAVLVSMVYFIGCTIMGMPYSLLIAVIMFVFNLIPFVGPFIGAVPCCLLLLLGEKPIQALWFLIFLLILQNLDGNIFAPWILGDSTGLPGVWILISILVGGGLFGMVGMFLGVPVCAVIYMLFKEFVENRLKKRNLPQQTKEYAGDVSHITPGYVAPAEEAPPEHEEHKHTFKEVVAEKAHDYKNFFTHHNNNPQNNGKNKTHNNNIKKKNLKKK